MSGEIHTIPLTDQAIAALEKRGLSAERVAELGWQSLDGRKGDWIGIPFYRGKKIVNWKYRTLTGEKRFSQQEGGEQCFYNLETLIAVEKFKIEEQTSTEVIICEGEMDCAIALQCGYYAVSVPSGAPQKSVEDEDSKKYEFLKEFPKVCIAVLAVDDDAAGRILRQDLALRLGWHRCKWVQYPKGCKDLNDVFVKYREKGVRMVLGEKSKFMNSGGLFTMSQLPAAPDIPALSCGVSDELATRIRIRPGDCIFITGIPSMGKSLFANCLMAHLANTYAWNVCIGSFEADPRGSIQKYLRTFYIERAAQTKEGFEQWLPQDIANADEWINRRFCFIVPDVNSEEMTSLKWLIERIRAAITQHGARIILIDPWNEIDHDRPQGMSLTEYTGFAIKELKRLGKRYMVTIVVVAHPSKPEKDKNGLYPVPTLYDISDSSHWYNKADIGIIIHRIEGEDQGKFATLVRVAKIREWDVMGRIGDTFLEYKPDTGRYLDALDFVPKKPKSTKSAPKAEPKEEVKTSPQMPLPYADD